MNSASIRKAIASLQQFYNDVALLYASLEEKLSNNMRSLPDAGRRVSWDITSAINTPSGWVMKNLQRLYVPISHDKEPITPFAYLYMVDLHEQSKIAEPAMICGYLQFSEDLTYRRIYSSEAWNGQYLREMVENPINWKMARDLQCDSKIVELRCKHVGNLIDPITLFSVDITTIKDSEDVIKKLIEPIQFIQKKRFDPTDFQHALQFPDELISAWNHE